MEEEVSSKKSLRCDEDANKRARQAPLKRGKERKRDRIDFLLSTLFDSEEDDL